MARRSTDAQIKVGVMSPNTISEILGVTPSAVRQWIKRGIIPTISCPGSKEKRISALDAFRFAEKYKFPFDIKLAEAAYNYALQYEPAEAKHPRRMIDTFLQRDKELAIAAAEIKKTTAENAAAVSTAIAEVSSGNSVLNSVPVSRTS